MFLLEKIQIECFQYLGSNTVWQTVANSQGKQTHISERYQPHPTHTGDFSALDEGPKDTFITVPGTAPALGGAPDFYHKWTFTCIPQLVYVHERKPLQ